VLFGAHVSGGIKNAVERGAAIGADAVQLFAQSPRAWRFPEWEPDVLERFRDDRREAGLAAAIVHAIYLVNLASPDDVVYGKSVSTMRATVDTACAIGADAVVFHVGSHLGAGLDVGLERAVPALEQVLERCGDDTWLLMENSAGAGGTIGRTIDELEVVLDRLGRHPRLGVCLDSCHLWVSGCDVTDREQLDRLVEDVDRRVGLERLRLLHVNDAAAPLGSNRDRHANIGEGVIGARMSVFLGHAAFQGLPAVLEVPGPDGHGPDAAELQKLRDLRRKGRRSAAAAARRRAATRSD
jgi:deoxyribonuclease IV